jgi:putative flippase GtrA
LPLSFTHPNKVVILSEVTRAFASYGVEGPAVAFAVVFVLIVCHPQRESAGAVAFVVVVVCSFVVIP